MPDPSTTTALPAGATLVRLTVESAAPPPTASTTVIGPLPDTELAANRISPLAGSAVIVAGTASVGAVLPVAVPAAPSCTLVTAASAVTAAWTTAAFTVCAENFKE